MSLLSLREYGKLAIGELDLSVPSVLPGQAAQLRSLRAIHGFDVFKLVNETTLSAQQYVGAVQIGNLTVEILPKVEGIDGTLMRRNLVAMLAVVLDLEISEGDIARVSTQRHGILEILIRLFCDKLFAQVHRGLVRRYEPRAENLSVMRGRIGITEQIRLNAANPERLHCRFDEFQEDNPLNQILKACIRLLLKSSRELSNQRRLGELLLVFEGVSEVSRSTLPWHLIRFDRLNQRYEPSFKLAELFLKATPPDVSGGSVQGFSLFFEMNTLFEEYIGRIARRVFRPDGFKVVLQGPQRYLTYDETTEREAFAMKPDVVGLKGNDAAWIIDTKWKELSKEEAKEGVAQGDMYQMYAYSNRYACADVVLLYPHHEGLGPNHGIRTRYRLHSWANSHGSQQPGRVTIGTVNLANLSTVPSQLRALFQTKE
jgi:5-methylcytosine-specific restriction enzyme subunit McrC